MATGGAEVRWRGSTVRHEAGGDTLGGAGVGLKEPAFRCAAGGLGRRSRGGRAGHGPGRVGAGSSSGNGKGASARCWRARLTRDDGGEEKGRRARG